MIQMSTSLALPLTALGEFVSHKITCTINLQCSISLMLLLFRYYKLLTWYSPRKIRHKCGWKSTEIIIQHSIIDSYSKNFFANIFLFRLYSLTGAEIVSIINHAVISTANDDRTRLTAEDLNKARDKVCIYMQLLSIEFSGI